MRRVVMLGVVLAGVVGSVACGQTVTAVTAPTAAGGSVAVVEDRPVRTIVYACAAREAMIRAFLDTKPVLPIITELPSGELVYIDWLERVYHHSGPTCE